ncbi:MAG: hypothetical protein U0168_13025 [Nannocystaceae bacterium]
MAEPDDDPIRIGAVARTDPAAAAEALDGPEGVGKVAGAEAIAAAHATAVESVTSGIGAGTMDVDAATAVLVADAVAAALGPGADPALVESIRAEVEALVTGDPTLANLLRR